MGAKHQSKDLLRSNRHAASVARIPPTQRLPTRRVRRKAFCRPEQSEHVERVGPRAAVGWEECESVSKAGEESAVDEGVSVSEGGVSQEERRLKYKSCCTSVGIDRIWLDVLNKFCEKSVTAIRGNLNLIQDSPNSARKALSGCSSVSSPLSLLPPKRTLL